MKTLGRASMWVRAALAAASTLGMVPASAGPLKFADVSAGSGIENFSVKLTPPQSGSGIAVIDYDEDGWFDLVLGGGTTQPTTLFRNKGGLKFQAVPPAQSGLGVIPGDIRGVQAADFDNDGDSDLYITNWDKNQANRLYRNDGGFFVDITAAAGVGLTGTSVNGAWGDYDNDGFLDLYVTRYWGEPNALYRNQGDGTFLLVNQQAGLDSLAKNNGSLSFQAVWMDWDRDGDLDLHEMNDRCYQGMAPNRLYLNQGDNTFVESAAAFGMDICLDAMGIGIADYDGDSFLDYFVSNVYYGHFFMKTGCGGVTDVTIPTGTSAYQWGWGVIFSDLDFDTHADLYIATAGYVTGKKPNFVFQNNGTGSFSDVSVASNGTAGEKDSGVVVRADFDLDGDTDLVIGHLFDGQGYTILRNDSPTGNSLRFRLFGTDSNRDGIGAWVEVYANGKRFIQNRHESETFSGSNEPTLVFGLGDAAAVQRLVVHWPSGALQIIDNPPVNTLFSVVEADSGIDFPFPYAERCGDGVDNDCDGSTDEGFDVGAPCSAGKGECESVGLMKCDAFGVGTVCTAVPGQPSDEVVDGLDNDCDGATDEPPPGGGPDCDPAELCGDSLDNDCDGNTDEGFEALGAPCSVGQGACAADGVWVCAPSGEALICGAQPGEEELEICNGADDDCDGSTDEGFMVGEPCFEELGSCVYAGVFSCDAGGGAGCVVPVGALPESCAGEGGESPELDGGIDPPGPIDAGEADSASGEPDAGSADPDSSEGIELDGGSAPDGSDDSETASPGEGDAQDDGAAPSPDAESDTTPDGGAGGEGGITDTAPDTGDTEQPDASGVDGHSGGDDSSQGADVPMDAAEGADTSGGAGGSDDSQGGSGSQKDVSHEGDSLSAGGAGGGDTLAQAGTDTGAGGGAGRAKGGGGGDGGCAHAGPRSGAPGFLTALLLAILVLPLGWRRRSR